VPFKDKATSSTNLQAWNFFFNPTIKFVNIFFQPHQYIGSRSAPARNYDWEGAVIIWCLNWLPNHIKLVVKTKNLRY
jgi:hypothetical protein